MTTAYTSLLGLALPVTGELSGTWGDTVNNSITSLLDTSVAGTTNVSTDGNVTLTTTTGAANTSRQAILLFSGARTAIRTVTAPAQSKIYTVINATTGGFAVTLVGAGPTTGVTIANGARTVVAWNGSDFVEVSRFSTLTTYADATIYGVTVGRGAGAVSTNTAVGASALAVNTSGAFNVAVGFGAADVNTEGAGLVAVGFNALGANTTGYSSTAIGWSAMVNNSTGISSSAVGSEALRFNTTGNYNVAVGDSALRSNTTASNNTAVGQQAGYSNTTGEVTAVGKNALYGNTTALYGTAVGNSALVTNTTGEANSALGRNALLSNSTGANNVGVGAFALQANTTASSNTAVGYQASYSNTTGYQNVAIGQQALYANTTGINSVAVGFSALSSNTTASDNVAVGVGALGANTTGYSNTAVGRAALVTNTTGIQNNAFGEGAMLYNTTGSYNVADGYRALFSNTTAGANTAIGSQAGYSATTNGSSTYVGFQAGYNTTGGENTFVGRDSGNFVTTGNKNTILGKYTGNQGGLDIRTASNKIVISDGDGNPVAYSEQQGDWVSNHTSTSGNAQFCLARGSVRRWFIWNANDTNNLNIVPASFTSGVTLTPSATAWSAYSDRRIKSNIIDLDYGLDTIMAMQPRRYTVAANGENSIGFIAQELKEVLPEAVVGEEIPFDDADTPQERSSKTMGIAKDHIIPVLVKAIQELKAEFDAYKATHP